MVVQSMTSTNTNDIDATVEQCIRIFDAGASMVRITTQGLKEVESFGKIKKELVKRGYKNPLVADVHYSPHVAKAAAAIADKVRINPGNFAGFKTGRTSIHTPTEFTKELTTIKEYLAEIVEVCKEHGTALRIGVNHGSLSDRILGRYGDTPIGMAESAMEFIRILEKLEFYDIVVSMKSSNVRVMVYSSRMLLKMMQEEAKVYPIHLGLTEAGEGEDGRMKSAIGIACLLSEGIGDTVRISLTEDPAMEIPVAQKIVDFFCDRANFLPTFDSTINYWPTFEFEKRVSLPSQNLGGHNHPVVILSLPENSSKETALSDAGYNPDGTTGSTAADFLFFKNGKNPVNGQKGISIISEFEEWKEKKHSENHSYPIIDLKLYSGIENQISGLHFLRVSVSESDELLKILDTDIFGAIDLELSEIDTLKTGKKFFNKLARRNCRMPVILHKKYSSDSLEDLILKTSGELGPFLLEGLGDGIWIEEEKLEIEPSRLREIAFGILQASGMRISRTEFISCPGCGRTLFDIQAVAQKIRATCSHLIGLKIAIMGCMVNGLGEMADADYGYIGAGPGKINLYRGKVAVKTKISEEDALGELIELIKADGLWKEFENLKI